MRISWNEKARQQLKRIEYFLLNEVTLDEDAVIIILKEIRNSPQKLLQFPRMGQLTDIIAGEEVRRILVKGYKIYYKVDVDTIVILNVLHSKEDIKG